MTTGDNQVDIETLREALRGARDQIITDSRDWSTSNTDARLYAVLVGWDDPDSDNGAMSGISEIHGWDREYVATLRRRRRAVARMLGEPS